MIKSLIFGLLCFNLAGCTPTERFEIDKCYTHEGFSQFDLSALRYTPIFKVLSNCYEHKRYRGREHVGIYLVKKYFDGEWREPEAEDYYEVSYEKMTCPQE